MSKYLGIELGSTRIKSVVIDDDFQCVCGGSFTWKSRYEKGIWTYDLKDAWTGLKAALASVAHREEISSVGISGMMHGYLAFDKDWKLVTPFRTWQNTITAQAAEILTKEFNFNIPQRWTIAHLYQSVLDNAPHIKDVAHITTLAGYIHYKLTGVNAIGIGEASGMFPIDSTINDYHPEMLRKFEMLTKDQPWNIRQLLPKVLVAGENAGCLTQEGQTLLDGMLPAGIPFAPPEGDAGTGMIATNAIAPHTGNVSSGTSIFSMVVLDKPLKKVYPEIDLVTTPCGAAVAMVHGNNCTNDMNVWIGMLKETANLFGANPTDDELYTKLFNISLQGAEDCDGILVYNYMAGEGVTHLDKGIPLVLRRPDSNFSLANFMRSQLYATMATLRLGMDILADEHIEIESLTGHGGLFKTPGVAQKFMAAACNASITVMKTAGEGGPYGMALLASYMMRKSAETLVDFLNQRVFSAAEKSVIKPDVKDVDGFNRYLENYIKGLEAEKAAVKAL